MKTLIVPFFLLVSHLMNAQDTKINAIKKGDFPPGVYMTLQDVLNKKPFQTTEVYFKTTYPNDADNLPEKAFFYYKFSDDRILDPLAVSYKGEMYFQTYNKYTNKQDKGYDPDQHSRYCKVINYGRFIYFEENMRGVWSKAFLGNVNPGTYLIKGKIKGIVLDLDNKEFNILRDCDDLNDFLLKHTIPQIECNSDKFTIDELRTKIDEINAPYR